MEVLVVVVVVVVVVVAVPAFMIFTASSLLAGSLMTWPTLSFRYWASLMLFSLLMAV